MRSLQGDGESVVYGPRTGPDPRSGTNLIAPWQNHSILPCRFWHSYWCPPCDHRVSLCHRPTAQTDILIMMILHHDASRNPRQVLIRGADRQVRNMTGWRLAFHNYSTWPTMPFIQPKGLTLVMDNFGVSAMLTYENLGGSPSPDHGT
jgi:hypothetical protein